MKQLEEESGSELPSGFGTFLINNHATDSLEDETFDAVVRALRRFEEPHQTVDPKEIPNYKPAAQARAARAIFIPGEGWVNPVALLAALRSILARSGRVEFIDGYCRSLERNGNRVARLHMESDDMLTGDVFVLSPGAAFSKIVAASNLDLQLPRIFYGIGCSILLKTGDATLANCVRTPNRGLACGVYAAPHDASHTLVGASNLISTEPEEHPRVTSVHTLLHAAMEQITADYYRSQLVKVNVGRRPPSEDTLPLLGKTSIDNLLVATGTKRDGLHCSPVISNLIADLILGADIATDVSLFRPERKPWRVYSREDAIDTAVRHMINAAYQHGFVPANDRMGDDLQRHFRTYL